MYTFVSILNTIIVILKLAGAWLVPQKLLTLCTEYKNPFLI